MWDFTTGALVSLLQPQAPPLTYALAATRDGTGFLTGDYVGTVREWDAATGALRGEHVVTAARLSSVAAHPDGRTIAAASEHGTVFFVDRETGKTLRTLQAHACWIQSLVFAESGRTLLTVGRQDHTVKVWREPFDAPVVLTGHTGMALRASMSDDGRRVATVSSDGTARLWDSHTGELLRVIHGPTTTATFRPRSDDLLTTGNLGYEVVWSTALDRRTPAEVATYVAERSPWKLVDGRLRLTGAGIDLAGR